MTTTEGLSVAERVKAYDRGISVRRRWIDRRGQTVNPSHLRVGDLVLAEIRLHAFLEEGADPVENIAIVDLLPGALEVENPRLATSAAFGKVASDDADHIEFLDDRVLIFTDVGDATKTFLYPLRVTTAGRFAIPPVQASSMYDPEWASVSGGGTVKVRR